MIRALAVGCGAGDRDPPDLVDRPHGDRRGRGDLVHLSEVIVSVMASLADRAFSHRRRDSAFSELLTTAALARLRPLWPVFQAEGKRTGLSPFLLAAVAWGESNWVPSARNSSSGALGLMQIMPLHDRSRGGGIDGLLERWQDPAFNARHGADILAYQIRARGNVQKGLAGYGGFSSWLRDPAAVEAGGPRDARWYIDEVLGRALVLEWEHMRGRLV